MTKVPPAANDSQSQGPNRSESHLETSKGDKTHLNQENQSRNDEEQGTAKASEEEVNDKETFESDEEDQDYITTPGGIKIRKDDIGIDGHQLLGDTDDSEDEVMSDTMEASQNGNGNWNHSINHDVDGMFWVYYTKIHMECQETWSCWTRTSWLWRNMMLAAIALQKLIWTGISHMLRMISCINNERYGIMQVPHFLWLIWSQPWITRQEEHLCLPLEHGALEYQKRKWILQVGEMELLDLCGKEKLKTFHYYRLSMH